MLELSSLLPGTALWALALYLPLSLPLARLEEALTQGPLPEGLRQIVLLLSSVMLAFAVGGITQLGLSWVLSPSWAASLGLMAVLAGAFWTLASRRDES
ncbi:MULTISPECIES: hypothetical protein [unclassified Synechococcus]|uniref:hypothetical protein n=1 Tax=unclassified Synechococcus TaxID=2626047 RepID=UPI0000698407|nr:MULTISPECIES: hypothetical protein [unclassified Synechococcus]EAQ75912.1 hypothetical protein WH5701_03664 [Synechococcus sp. WH 5701]MCP9824210.1 hypothetical protein [Synechococcus sp. EJ6-Ellesmere]WFN59454.1 hypothetical protein N4320_02195 [Synechococcus sp. CCFWC 502]CAK6695649.1 hypothetical protein ICNINCKA_01867 [Synechococcus sp. CBW1107]